MDTIYYTKSYDVNSSLVEGIYFNENNSTVVLDLQDKLYCYDDVSASDIEPLVSASSAGSYYNTTFKHQHGPATYLGFFDDTVFEPVSVTKDTPGTPKGLTDLSTGATKEFSLNSAPVYDQSVSGAPITFNGDVTKEFSLKSPELSVVHDEVTETYVVHFTLKGYDEKFKFTADGATSVEDAIEALHKHVSVLGISGVVKKVVVKFD